MHVLTRTDAHSCLLARMHAARVSWSYRSVHNIHNERWLELLKSQYTILPSMSLRAVHQRPDYILNLLRISDVRIRIWDNNILYVSRMDHTREGWSRTACIGTTLSPASRETNFHVRDSFQNNTSRQIGQTRECKRISRNRCVSFKLPWQSRRWFRYRYVYLIVISNVMHTHW